MTSMAKNITAKLVQKISMEYTRNPDLMASEEMALISGDESWYGSIFIVSDGIAQILIEGDEIAVMTSIENGRLFYKIIKVNDIEFFKNQIRDILNIDGDPNVIVDLLHSKFLSIKEMFLGNEKENTTIKASPNTAIFRASVSGKLDVKKDFVLPAKDHYSFSTKMATAMQIGSGIDTDVSSTITACVQMLTIAAAQRISNAYKIDTYGTNYSVVGLAVS